ncbi:MAG: argininosuccinate lyase [Clostridiales bacterium GWF2_38_85]|nr:MAG: argininosuccinate lyase [Clostridiales bacterium GWF2_38_85]HBL84263.1 argininosuccinate lyase [Clostridiales bacterium]
MSNSNNKLWEGRFKKQLDGVVNDFNASIHFDSRMFREDITGSVAHTQMLAKQGIITVDEGEKIIEGLCGILEDIENGKLEFDFGSEDIHSFVEKELTERIGDEGKRLHTARSRNDQVALDIRMYLKKEIDCIVSQLKGLILVLCTLVEKHATTIMPGYTHLQRAQPVSFGHHLLAYANMFSRDIDRLSDTKKRMNVLPLGSCALAGTTFDTDRGFVAEQLGFDSVCGNSIDGVSDRDFVVETAAACSLIMTHLSRFSEEIILWCSWEFKFIELDDAYSTGSSIMPQKKNPDIAELVRGKSGRVYGNLISLLTMLKGLPLAYNKDMQEDKEAIFSCIDTVKLCIEVFTPMVETMRVLPDNMKSAAAKGFINATDGADYLVSKGLPFRSAYKAVGQLVEYCIENKKTLEELTLDEYKQFSELFDNDVYKAIDLLVCLEKRTSEGGTAPTEVLKQAKKVKEKLL